MTSQNGDVDEQDPGILRRELERVAFARPKTKAGAAAAQRALRKLVAADEVERLARVASKPVAIIAPDPVRPIQPIDLADPLEPVFHDDDAQPPTPRRRTLIPLVVAIGLVVGLGVGVLTVRGSPALFSASKAGSSTAKHSATPNRWNATNALAQLGAPQTSRDVFPIRNFASSLDLETGSIHRILETSDGLTLWIGRSPEDICMMFTDPNPASGVDAGSSCASITAFPDSGLHLEFDRDLWTWDGTSFTTTVNN
jgi:hypothetical protein